MRLSLSSWRDGARRDFASDLSEVIEMLIYESKVLLISHLLTIRVWQVDTISDIINNLLGTDRPHPQFSANGSSFFHTTCTKQLEAIMNYASQAAWH